MIYYFQGEVEMSLFKAVKRVLVGLTAALFLMSVGNLSAKEIKIGVIYDYTGPLAAGGSSLHALGAKIIIDYFNSKGGVEGYKINAIYADAQSKPEIATVSYTHLTLPTKCSV